MGVVVPSMSSRMTRTSSRIPRLKPGIGPDIRRSPAHGLEALIGPAVRVVGRPSGFVLEEPDRADVPIGAKIEPVPGPPRHPNQIARLDFDGDDGPLARVNVKQPTAADDEANLVLFVEVLGTELRQHGLEIRCRRW